MCSNHSLPLELNEKRQYRDTFEIEIRENQQELQKALKFHDP